MSSPDDDAIRECEQDLESGDGLVSLDDYEQEQNKAQDLSRQREDRGREERDEHSGR